MALVLARFLFGMALVLICALLLGAATWLCLRLVRAAVQRFSEPRAQDLASGAGILLVVCATLAGMYVCSNYLYEALGTSPLVRMGPGWLAGDGALSPAALLGGISGLGLLVWATTLLRPRAPQADQPPPRAETRVAPARQAQAAPRGPRRRLMFTLALFLLAIGGVLLLFAHIVAPLGVTEGIPGAAPMAERVWPVYLAAFGLMGAGCCALLLWWLWRAPAATAGEASKPGRRK